MLECDPDLLTCLAAVAALQSFQFGLQAVQPAVRLAATLFAKVQLPAQLQELFLHDGV
jgi:hypothetical protein